MDPTVLRLADQFASAAVDGDMWMPALKALADATGSARGQLIGIGGAATVPFNWVNDFSQEALAEFVAMDGGNPLVNPRVTVSVGAAELQVFSERDYETAYRRLPSDHYRDFAREYEIPNGCQTKLLENDDGLIGLAVLRTEHEGQTSEDDRALFKAVAPHVRSAVRTQLALEGTSAAMISQSLEAAQIAAFICGDEGLVLAMSPSAEAMIRSGRLRIRSGRLDGGTARGSQALRKAIAEHLVMAARPMDSIVVESDEMDLPLVVDICRAPQAPWRFHHRPHVLVIVRSGARWHGAAPRILETLYRLSPAEADVALRLARGERREGIAEARGAGLETVRAQLKSAFAKLGVAREVELVALLSGLLRV